MVTIKGNILSINRLKRFKESRISTEMCSLVHYMDMDLYRESISPSGTYDSDSPVWENSMDIDIEKSSLLWFDQYTEEEKIKILKIPMPGDYLVHEETWIKFIGFLTENFRSDRLKFLDE